jgi:glycosyltransferase involved in cell wall biosynthesis
MSRATASVIIPAFDEAAVLGQTLHALLLDVEPGTLDVVVVANGCTDDTAAVARAIRGVRVVEIAEASKATAVAVGNRAALTFPRVHLDADCTIPGSDVVSLARALDAPGVLASGPMRHLDTTGASWWVRGYYRVWERLPGVRAGLYGRGVIALSQDGQARVDALPRAMSDDLAISEAFAPAERRIVVGTTVTVRVPRTAADLIRRRVRVATGNHQADDLGVRRPGSRTSVRTLVRVTRHDLRLLLQIPIFVITTLVARTLSRRAVRRGDYTTWLRDESSRISDGVTG